MSILIGTSGYSYPDWKGHFYPPAIKSGDMLSYYARRFSAVEINSTYYGMPRPAAMEQLTRKVPPDFLFTVKGHGSMTHGQGFEPEAYAQFRAAMDPLQAAGMLGCVLLQFPWGFQRTTVHEGLLRAAREELVGLPLVVEFRNDTWAGEDVFELLRSLEIGYCCVDEPRLKGLMPPVVTATSSVGYVRFHGRNAAKWWQHRHAWERYDYLYSQPELQEWVPPIRRLQEETERTFLLFNNCHEAKSSHNAQDMAELLQLPLRDPAGAEPPPPKDAGQGVLSFD